MCTWILVGGAWADDVYTSQVIKIHETGKTALDAKDKGFDNAIAGFWDTLMTRITLNPQQAQKIPKAERDSYVKNIDIIREKTHSNRYEAEIRLHFDSEKVYQGLRAYNVTFIEDRGFPALIVPVFEYKGVQQIYEPSNMWQTALQSVDPSGGLLPLYISDKGVQDSLRIDSHTLDDMEKIRAVSVHYNVDSVFITTVQVSENGVVLRYRSVGGILDGTTHVIKKRFDTPVVYNDPQRDEKVFNVLRDGAVDFFTHVQTQWKHRHTTAEKSGNKQVLAVFNVESLADWHALQDTLESYYMVRRADLQSVQGDIATVSIQYTGVLKNFYLFLQKKQYTVHQDNTTWLVATPAK